MANTLIIYAHPNSKSFNHAILETTQAALTAAGDEVRVRDLYAQKFQPVLGAEDFIAMGNGAPQADVQEEQAHIKWADKIIFIYPMWWGDRPAILKGYIDRVFTNGFAYEYNPAPRGLLDPRKALVIQTVGGPDEWYPEGSLDALNKAMVEWSLEWAAIKPVAVKTLFAVPFVTDDARHQMLEEIKAVVKGF